MLPPLECGAPKPPLLRLEPVAANCGVGRSCTMPDLVTWVLRWFRLRTEPRGIPIPAEPLFTTSCEVNRGENTGPPLPTVTV